MDFKSGSQEGFQMADLTAKELSSIQDQLAYEENVIKKFKMYAQNSQDPSIRNTCEEIAKKHQGHFTTLMGHLN
jgi:hypothetical protein